MSLPEKPSRRLFYALWPDDATRRRLAAVSRELPDHAGRQVHVADLHITLQYLGQVPGEDYPCVADAMDRVDATAFPLEISQVVFWRRPRVIWCGPEDTPGPLSRLVRDLGGHLADCGYPPETRPFKPHVTLVRKARTAPVNILSEPIRWKVQTIALVESLSIKDPPRYRPLKRWQLN